MATEISSTLSVREGLIQVVNVERFQSKPRSGGNTHVVVMEKAGDVLRHYCTLKSDTDRLSIGEQLWGRFVCYIVDLSSRELRIEQEFPTRDRITSIRVVADVIYRAVDAERVTLGVDDALQSLHKDLTTVLRRGIARLPLEQVTEETLETRLNQESARFQSRLGIAIERTRVRVDWPEEVLARRRAADKQVRAQQAEDAQRQRAKKLEDEDRRRRESLEVEDIEHIDDVIQRLGLEGLSADFRLRLHSMSREEALNQIIELIGEERQYAREVWGRRMEEEYALLRELIDKGVLEEMDLVEFGKGLLDRYQHSMALEQTFGAPPSVLFGEVPRPRIGTTQESQKDSPDDRSAGADKPSEENATTESEAVDSDSEDQS